MVGFYLGPRGFGQVSLLVSSFATPAIRVIISDGPLSGVVAYGYTPATLAIPETPTWAMMLLGFAGLGYAGYRTSRKASGAHAEKGAPHGLDDLLPQAEVHEGSDPSAAADAPRGPPATPARPEAVIAGAPTPATPAAMPSPPPMPAPSMTPAPSVMPSAVPINRLKARSGDRLLERGRGEGEGGRGGARRCEHRRASDGGDRAAGQNA